MLAPLLDLVYLLVVVLSAPWWMRKTRGGWSERFGTIPPLPAPTKPRLLLHAVSVGEVNLTTPLVEALGDDVEVVLSVTTDTGIERAHKLYADRLSVVRYPLDASWSVRRFLNAIQPSAVALVELELWPNFLDQCAKRDIPVGVVNGRLSARSFRGYRRLRTFLKKYFARLAFAGVQDDDYRQRFVAMGTPEDRCAVVGTMKWDTVTLGEDVPGIDELARELGIDRAKPLIVGGSTAPGEHELLRDATPEGTQLLCAPRRPEWFDDAAGALAPCVRRSAGGDASEGRFLLDTIGELRAAYALADVVVVGRSFADLHGSDPMEPAALGKPVLIGPAHGDFQHAVGALASVGALRITSRERLAEDLKAAFARKDAMGASALRIVELHQGASERYAAMVRTMMGLEHSETPDARA